VGSNPTPGNQKFFSHFFFLLTLVMISQEKKLRNSYFCIFFPANVKLDLWRGASKSGWAPTRTGATFGETRRLVFFTVSYRAPTVLGSRYVCPRTSVYSGTHHSLMPIFAVSWEELPLIKKAICICNPFEPHIPESPIEALYVWKKARQINTFVS
jgi:hypothetical protein